jgi:hypothetical protein
MEKAGSFRRRPLRLISLPDYGVVLVPVVDVAGEVVTVGPPALLAERASARPTPVNARRATTIVVLRSQDCAWRTPAGLPGAKAVESANALGAQSASDIAKQMALFTSNPLEGFDETLDKSRSSRNQAELPDVTPSFRKSTAK